MTGTEFKAKIYRSIISFFGKLPLNALYKVGNFAAWGMRSVVSYRKNVIYTNLARSFPEKKYEEIEAIARDYYKRLGNIAAETIWFGGCNGNGDKLHRQRIYDYTNPEVLLNANKERGVMCMTSHCGNWELLGGIYEYSYTIDLTEHIDKNNFYVAYRAMYNKVSDKVFYENRRAPLPDPAYCGDARRLRACSETRLRRPVHEAGACRQRALQAHIRGHYGKCRRAGSGRADEEIFCHARSRHKERSCQLALEPQEMEMTWEFHKINYICIFDLH